MCGRYSLATPNPAEVRSSFPIGDEIEVQRRFNVAPGDTVLTVTRDREGRPRGDLLRWGLVPFWAKTPETGLKMINARVETVAERPAFRHALERYRCLVIADGFYEWQRVSTGPKQAFHIKPAQGGVFAFAGLWSIWQGEESQRLRTCTILTTEANSAVAPLHDRMPIILPAGAESAWLDPSTSLGHLDELLAGLSAPETAVQPVGPAVNDARYDGPQCLAPPVRSGQETLF
jgi:putative SOS response-associated peptidase YedK